MNDRTNAGPYPPPQPERVEQARRALHGWRAKLRRVRMLGASGAVVVIAAVAAVALVASNRGHQLRVVGPATTASSSTEAPTTTSTSTTTPLPPTTARPTTTTLTVAPGTQVITYQPFTATGAVDPALRVTAQVTGTCVAGLTDRSQRCFGSADSSGAGIYDPCFPDPLGGAQPLVCPANPVTPDVVLFTATSRGTEPKSSPSSPWAMQLANGRVCLFVSAAWGGLGPYGCGYPPGGGGIPADCHAPVATKPWWTAACQDYETDANPFVWTRVTKVWY